MSAGIRTPRFNMEQGTQTRERAHGLLYAYCYEFDLDNFIGDFLFFFTLKIKMF